jgi:lipid-A-disaccharide synthase-like uncharacterized protein
MKANTKDWIFCVMHGLATNGLLWILGIPVTDWRWWALIVFIGLSLFSARYFARLVILDLLNEFWEDSYEHNKSRR